MLSINNLSLQFGGQYLFKDISAQIQRGDHVGLVGVNGAGKSTLMRTMCGLADSDPGVITRASWFTVAYLPQEPKLTDSGRTLYEEAERAFDAVLAQQKELETLHQDLADLDPNDPRMDSLLQRQGELQHALEESGVFNMQPRIERVLFGLGFKSQDLARPVNQFSGGWVMRQIGRAHV